MHRMEAVYVYECIQTLPPARGSSLIHIIHILWMAVSLSRVKESQVLERTSCLARVEESRVMWRIRCLTSVEETRILRRIGCRASIGETHRRIDVPEVVHVVPHAALPPPLLLLLTPLVRECEERRLSSSVVISLIPKPAVLLLRAANSTPLWPERNGAVSWSDVSASKYGAARPQKVVIVIVAAAAVHVFADAHVVAQYYGALRAALPPLRQQL